MEDSAKQNKLCQWCGAKVQPMEKMERLYKYRGGWLCENHRSENHRQIMVKVDRENARTVKAGLIADLSYEQWQRALNYYIVLQHPEVPAYVLSCAYCGQNIGTDWGIDHWIAITRGGGTTVANCIPCCSFCNIQKGAFSGDAFFELLITRFQSANAPMLYERAKKYFLLVKAGDEDFEHFLQERIESERLVWRSSIT